MHRCLSSIALVVLAAGAALGQVPATPAWDLTPYRIKVLIAAERKPDLPAAIEAQLERHLAARAAGVVGASWKLRAEAAADELRSALLTDLSAVGAAAIAPAAKDADKVILLAIKSSGGGCTLEAREWDALTNLWNVPVLVEAAGADFIPQAAFRAVLAAFAPLARIESVEGGIATLRLRGAALGVRDRGLPAVQPGMAFRPVLASSEANGALKTGAAQPIAWTWLTPQDGSASALRCRVETAASGNPIPAYHPLRQRLAIGVSPAARGTKLKLVSRGEKPEPLEGYEVLAEEAGPAGPVTKPLARSDRAGLATVPPGPQALRLLIVRHGEQPLLRLPLVPGLESEVTLPLPDVRGAVALDAALAELEDSLIDLAAQREVLAVRLKAASDAAAQSKLKEQQAKLPKPDALAAKLQQHEQAAKASEPLVQPRLLAKIAALRKLLDQLEGKSGQ